MFFCQASSPGHFDVDVVDFVGRRSEEVRFGKSHLVGHVLRRRKQRKADISIIDQMVTA